MIEKARVLVADDEANIIDLVAMALRYDGLDVEIAASGSAALERGQQGDHGCRGLRAGS